MLNTDDWLIGDEDINIAKGKYEAPLHQKDIKQHIKHSLSITVLYYTVVLLKIYASFNLQMSFKNNCFDKIDTTRSSTTRQLFHYFVSQ